MTISCFLEVASDKAELEENGRITLEAELETLPRIGDSFYFNDSLNHSSVEERDLRIELESTYLVTRVVHNMLLDKDSEGKLHACPNNADFRPYTIDLDLEVDD